jgi:hypothetical protein
MHVVHICAMKYEYFELVSSHLQCQHLFCSLFLIDFLITWVW